MLGVVPALVLGDINLDLRPAAQTAGEGGEVRIGLYAVSDSAAPQLMSAADVILGWDPAYLRLLGNDNTGAVPMLMSAFPAIDPYGLNEASPPQDGNGLYLAYAFGAQPVVATPAGTLLTTFRFTTLAETPATQVAVLASAGSPTGHTIVYDGAIPGLIVTGTLGSAEVRIPACGTGDFDVDGDVDVVDFAAFQACFTGAGGQAGGACACVFDFEPDADIDYADFESFAVLLGGPGQ